MKTFGNDLYIAVLMVDQTNRAYGNEPRLDYAKWMNCIISTGNYRLIELHKFLNYIVYFLCDLYNCFTLCPSSILGWCSAEHTQATTVGPERRSAADLSIGTA